MLVLQNIDVAAEEQREVGEILAVFSGEDRSLSERQIDELTKLFDMLIEKIETRVLVDLAEQIATHPDIPLPVVRRLARHDETRVASPVLTKCERITEQDLINIATTERDPHLLAISKRNKISERIVDVLIGRGSRAVRHSVVENDGACISLAAFDTLSYHANTDDELAFKVGTRNDVPPHVFCQLLVEAGHDVRDRLLSLSRRDIHAEILRAVDRASGMVADEQAIDPRHALLERRLRQRFFVMDEDHLKIIMKACSKDELQVALAILSNVSVATVADLLSDQRVEPLLIIGRAFGFDWTTVADLIQLYFPRLRARDALQTARGEFDRINPSTAHTVLQLWRMREARGANQPQ